MLVPLAIPFGFLTWRECVAGMKPTESVQMDIRRTWDVPPKTISTPNGSQTFFGGVNSETIGFVRWRMRETTLFGRPCRQLTSEAFDKKAEVLVSEEVWVDFPGNIIRQREERTTNDGKRTSDAAFYPDRIELSRVDPQGKTTFALIHPAGGMEEVQRRFKPLAGGRKEFVRLNGIDGSLVKVLVEKSGRFRGTWSGMAYDGSAFRFTIDGKEQTAMLTSDDETVQVDFSKELQLVMAGTPKSRRKGELQK